MIDRQMDLEARFYLSTLALRAIRASTETITVAQGVQR